MFYIIPVSVNIIENIRKGLDDGNISCGIFVDLQKARDTADQQILLAKLNHYGIFRVPNNCIKSYYLTVISFHPKALINLVLLL